jgi:hypothetical protein
LAFHSGREADHSPPSSAEVKECVELYLHSPNTTSWRGAQLGGAQCQEMVFLSYAYRCRNKSTRPGCHPDASLETSLILLDVHTSNMTHFKFR